MRLILADCLDAMADMEPNSIDAIVTDPPYGLEFMGKEWDKNLNHGPWASAALRVAKPGCHLLAFGGTRTFHRLVCALEDAGWEIRNMLGWLYGSGFPKSHDISKAIDKAAGVKRPNITETKIDLFGKFEEQIWTSQRQGSKSIFDGGKERPATYPATYPAKQWAGWGTALKPALEPITLARKPPEGTVAENVQKWGCGVINVDECRVRGEKRNAGYKVVGKRINGSSMFGNELHVNIDITKGRWPANLIHDGSEEVLEVFPNVRAGVAVRHNSGGNTFGGNNPKPPMNDMTYADSGSAARFFYCAKASRAEREAGLEGMPKYRYSMNQPCKEGTIAKYGLEEAKRRREEKCVSKNNHPTVKPLALMRYLCRLITPPGGTILDPFMGSGTTGMAAKQEGFDFIGIEKDVEYFKIAERRIKFNKEKKQSIYSEPLFEARP